MYKTFKQFVEGKFDQGHTFIDPDGVPQRFGLPTPPARRTRTADTVVTKAPVIKKSVLGSQYDAQEVGDDDIHWGGPEEKEKPAPKPPRISKITGKPIEIDWDAK